jgi:hypothetical protein
LKNAKLFLLLIAISLFTHITYSQENDKNKFGEIHGNFDLTTQYYRPDSAIGAPPVPEKILMNGFANLIYTKGNFSAGLRYESYQNVLLGFDPNYQGSGIPFRYASYAIDGLEVTVGNFFEQFGNGLIFRAYEERGLGVDNAMEGVRLKYTPVKGLYLKGMIGKQRLFFRTAPGIVRGFDGELNFNEAIAGLAESKTKFSIGGSVISKYQRDDNPTYILPENVASFAGRGSIARGKFSLVGEHVYKVNDPSFDNGYIYKPGQATYIAASFSQKGLGITLSAKAVDNMSFRSDRNEVVNNALINFLPALSKQHTYNLAATLYPYATQLNGEVAFQADIVYKAAKGSPLGGKYGTTFFVNIARANGIDSTHLNDLDTKRQGYKTNYFSPGREIFFQDINIEMHKKLSKSLSFKAMYMNMIFNNSIMLLAPTAGTYFVDIAVLDVTYKIKPKHAIRLEAQGLWTKQDQGDWLFGLIEYTYSPHWFIAFINQYNYGNPNPDQRLNYPIGSIGYIKNANRFTLSAGRQRAGIFCVGGVCRNVPASNGFTLSVTSSF